MTSIYGSLLCISSCASLFNRHFLGRLQVEQQQSFSPPTLPFSLVACLPLSFLFCSLHFALSFVSYSEMFNKIIKGGELLPAAPLQPCAEAPSGRGGYRICWTWLTWPKDIMPAMRFHVWTMPPLAGQAWGTPSVWRHVPRPLIRSSSGRWVLSEPCWYIPCPTLPTKEYCVFFVSARHNININFEVLEVCFHKED